MRVASQVNLGTPGDRHGEYRYRGSYMRTHHPAGSASMGRMDISAVVGMWLDRPPEEALHTAVLADRLGFGELWIGEAGTWDAFALATAVGLATDAIAMTVGPLAVAVRDPAMIAMGAASVAALTRRRVGVALGTSNPTAVEEWHGRSRAGAADTLEQSVRAVSTLRKGGRMDGTGRGD